MTVLPQEHDAPALLRLTAWLRVFRLRRLQFLSYFQLLFLKPPQR